MAPLLLMDHLLSAVRVCYSCRIKGVNRRYILNGAAESPWPGCEEAEGDTMLMSAVVPSEGRVSRSRGFGLVDCEEADGDTIMPATFIAFFFILIDSPWSRARVLPAAI